MTKLILKHFLLFSLIFTSFNYLKASHNLGGEITWKDLGGGKYRIIAKIYRDCRGIALVSPEFGCFATSQAGSSCGSDTLMGFTRTAIINASTTCKWTTTPCSPANTYNSGEGMEIHVYERIVDVNKAPLNKYYGKSSCSIIGFYLYQCCRPNSIQSIPQNNNLYVTCSMNFGNLNKCKSTKNSSPSWNRMFPTFNCCNQGYYVNPGLTDSNEFDQFKFQLTPVILGVPSSIATYNAPFTYQYPITPYCVPATTVKCTPQPEANPPRGTWLDSITGDFIYTPTKCDEVAPIVMQATEYRRDTSGNLVWIGKTSREFIISVRDDCGYNNVPLITGNFNTTVCAGEKICIKYKIYDQTFLPYQTTRDTVTAYWTSPIKNAQVTVTSDTGANVKNVEICWQTSKADIRDYPYIFSLEARDGHCPKQAISSRGISILVKDNDSSGFKTNLGNCNTLYVDGYVGKLANAKGSTTYSWAVYDTLLKKNIALGYKQKDTFPMLKKGTYIVSLWTSNDKVCMPAVNKTITISADKPTVSLGKDFTICKGNPVAINSIISNAKSPFSYDWMVREITQGSGIPIVTKYTTKDISFTPGNTGSTIFITAVDSNKCTMKDTLLINFHKALTITTDPKLFSSRCWSSGNFYLQDLITNPNTALQQRCTLRMWGNKTQYGTNGLVDSLGNGVFSWNTAKINNATDLQNGKNITETVTIWVKDTNGCVSTISGNIRINGNPIIDLDSLSFCQDDGEIALTKAVVRPKVSFGTKQEWFLLDYPSAVNPTNLITDKSGGAGTDWWMNIGLPAEEFYAGDYKLRFRVTDVVTTCFTDDTTIITIVAEPKLTATNKEFCEGNSKNDLLTIFNANGGAPSEFLSTFKIYALNADTTSANFAGAKIINGHYLSANTKPGIWTITCKNAETGCPSIADFDITINPKPFASFSTTPIDTTAKTSPVFTVKNGSIVLPTVTLNYQWYFDKFNPNLSSSAFEPQIIYDAKDSTYFVKLIATSDKACSDTFYRRLVVGKGGINAVSNFEISTVKLNNKFMLLNDDILMEQIWIFDLAGRMVYNSKLNTGVELPIGNYSYIIQLKSNFGKSITVKGKKMVE